MAKIKSKYGETLVLTIDGKKVSKSELEKNSDLYISKGYGHYFEEETKKKAANKDDTTIKKKEEVVDPPADKKENKDEPKDKTELKTEKKIFVPEEKELSKLNKAKLLTLCGKFIPITDEIGTKTNKELVKLILTLNKSE